MAIKRENLMKRFTKRFSNNPKEALKFYASPIRIEWYFKKKLGKLPSNYPADNMRLLSNIKKAEIKKVTAGGLTKNCILTNSNFSFTTNNIKIKEGDKLNFSIRLNKIIKDNISFKVSVNKDILFLKRINTKSFKTKDWLDININLNKYKNKNIKIKFSTKTNKNSKESVIWSEPIILNKNINKPNVILISIDSCRKDHLNCYGYDKKTTPNINKLNTINFENIYSQTLWTDDSHRIMLTSLYPYTYKLYKKRDKKIITLPEVLRDNGYLTYANTSAWRAGPEILGKGFDYFKFKQINKKTKEGSAEEKINSSIKFLKKINKNPFFMFLHFMDAHEPYDAPEEYKKSVTKNYSGKIDTYNLKRKIKKEGINIKKLNKEDLDYLKGLYDAGIKYIDNEVNKLINVLKKEKIYDNTLIIITADHGEEFTEHGKLYHYKFYDETINVPFILKLPKKFNKKKINKKVIGELMDLFPTVTEILKLKSPPNIQGKPIFNKSESDLAFSEHWITKSNKTYSFSIRSNKFKYIYTKPFNQKEIEEIYDLKRDPKEKRNIVNKKILEIMRKERKNFFKNKKI